jgi:hypothetical protein
MSHICPIQIDSARIFSLEHINMHIYIKIIENEFIFSYS